LFWGAFFVEHAGEWFSGPLTSPPPAWVWAAQGFHLLIVLGLGGMVWKEAPGVVATLVGSLGFCLIVTARAAWWLALANLIPIAFLAIAWWMSQASRAVAVRPQSPH
jgi:hypothetical protein